MALDTTFDLPPETDLPDPETDTLNDDQPDLAPTAPAVDRPAAEPVSHTPGGLPAIPLAITTANSAIAGLSAAAITGGPVGVAVAGIALAAVATGVAARGSRKKNSRSAAASRSTSAGRTGGQGTSARTGSTTANRSASATGRGAASGKGPSRSPLASSNARTPGAASRGGNRAGGLNLQKTPSRGAASRQGLPGARPNSGTGVGLGKTPARGNGAGKGGTLRAGKGTHKAPTKPAGSTGKGAASGKGAGRLSAVRDLRKNAKNTAPTRAALRKQDTANRNRLADAKRAFKDAKHDARIGRLNKKGGAARTLAKALDRAHKARRATGDAARDRKKEKVASRLDRIRGMRRRAAAHLRMRRRLAGSGLRYWGRRLLNAGIAAPFGLLGCLTTPLGRKLGWSWLMKPGSKVLARLNQRALNARAFRDHNIRGDHKADTQRINDEIAGTVPRAPRHHNTYDAGVTVSEALKFLFDESASEMEVAAQAYEPGGNMHVLQTIEGMPAAVQSFANTFAIIAEKSDESWAMEPEVGEALNDVFQILSKAVEAAEQVKVVFETVHEADISRIREPRRSVEAEKGWDVINNEDYA